MSSLSSRTSCASRSHPPTAPSWRRAPGARAPPAPPPAPPPPPGQADPRQLAVERAVTWALSKVGTRQCAGEQPNWNRAFGKPDCKTPWCGIFVGSALDQAGFVVNRGKIPSTEQTYADARSGLSGLSTIPKENAQRGDLIFFNYVGPPRVVSHVGLVTAAGGGRISTVEGNTNEPSAVATHEFQINNKKIVGIVRVSGLKGEPAGYRQYKAPNTKLRRKLARRLRKLKGRNIEVGPGQKVPRAARR